MKHRYSIIIATSLALVGAIVTMSLVSSQESDTQYLQIVNPDVPAKLKLCGSDIRLDRDDMYERFDREITSMIYTHGNTLLTIKRANKYFHVMAPILKKNNVPEDLLYVACIESYLNPTVKSPKGAAGFWQFMPETAKSYGLEVNDEIDERFNIEKSTEAACRFFKSLYSSLGSWGNALAAYNCGQGNITKMLAKQGVTSIYDLQMNDETSRYPFRVMAMKCIVEDPASYGFQLRRDQLYQPVDYKEMKVDGPVDSWISWAKDHGITYQRLRRDNPWIVAPQLTNKNKKTYMVKVPVSDAAYSHTKQDKKIYNDRWTH